MLPMWPPASRWSTRCSPSPASGRRSCHRSGLGDGRILTRRRGAAAPAASASTSTPPGFANRTTMPAPPACTRRVVFRQQDLFTTPLGEATSHPLPDCEINFACAPRHPREMPAALASSATIRHGRLAFDQRRRVGSAASICGSSRPGRGNWTLTVGGQSYRSRWSSNISGSAGRPAPRASSRGASTARISALPPISARAGEPSKAGSRATGSSPSPPMPIGAPAAPARPCAAPPTGCWPAWR